MVHAAEATIHIKLRAGQLLTGHVPDRLLDRDVQLAAEGLLICSQLADVVGIDLKRRGKHRVVNAEPGRDDGTVRPIERRQVPPVATLHPHSVGEQIGVGLIDPLLDLDLFY